MNKEFEEIIADLLEKKATIGLEADEQSLLDELKGVAGFAEKGSLEVTAAAIGLVNLQIDEPLPEKLRAQISSAAADFFAASGPLTVTDETTQVTALEDEYQKTFTVEPRRSWNWLGWAVAATACIVLAVNVWTTRVSPTEVVGTAKTPAFTPEKLTPDQEYAQLIASQAAVTKATWGAGNMKDLKEVGGDVVWSDEKQRGFMRLRGLPVNDKSKETYQLWIFDKTQDKATPIDGGTFDIDAAGEAIIPIDAKLKAIGPELFAITVEKPGGVVVSKREKIAALAKVDISARSNS